MALGKYLQAYSIGNLAKDYNEAGVENVTPTNLRIRHRCENQVMW